MNWRPRLWPSSLYGQLLLVTAVALLLAQIVNTTMLIAGARAQAVVEASSVLVARLSNQIERQRLGDNGDGDRKHGHDNRRDHEGHRPAMWVVETQAPLTAQRFQRYDDLVERAEGYLLAVDPAIQDLRLSVGAISGLPPELRSAIRDRARDRRYDISNRESPRQAVFLTMKAGDGHWINAAAPVRPLRMEPSLMLLFQTSVLYLAVLIPLALIARRIARPLRLLTQRVNMAGLANEAAPLEPQGPSDVRELIVAFNGAQARLNALLVEKDVMLGAIGHDLKTPLASLRVRIESVEDSEERDKMAATIDEMVVILDDILMLARMGKGGELAQKTDIAALVDAIVEELPKADLVELFPPDAKVTAVVRPVLVKRAVRNLLDNALQYGGNARIFVERGGQSVRIKIDDDGPGIAPDQIASMFEPFARADSSRRRSHGGSGLGLTIARAIATAHGGTVQLVNRSGGGLSAVLTFPLE